MTCQAFAKLNLTLEVVGRRADGFHALRSLVLPIDLSDTLTFIPAAEFSTDTGYSDDLILKAVRALRSGGHGGESPQAYAIRVSKRIPVGGGLGGGSADAAATLLALNALWHLSLSPEQLAEIGAAVGSDVPALVLTQHYRRPVLMEGRGELVSLIPDDDPVLAGCGRHLVLANPRVHSSTPAVYAAFDRMAGDDAVRQRANHLEMPAIALHPEIGEAMDSLRCAGATNVMMSGSGSTVFGFTDSASSALRIAAAVQAASKYDIISAQLLT